MIRAEFTMQGGGHVAMVVPDDSPQSFARVVALADAMQRPASVRMIPIPADITDRHRAMFWYPERTPPKENDGKHSTPPCLDDGDTTGG